MSIVGIGNTDLPKSRMRGQVRGKVTVIVTGSCLPDWDCAETVQAKQLNLIAINIWSDDPNV